MPATINGVDVVYGEYTTQSGMIYSTAGELHVPRGYEKILSGESVFEVDGLRAQCYIWFTLEETGKPTTVVRIEHGRNSLSTESQPMFFRNTTTKAIMEWLIGQTREVLAPGTPDEEVETYVIPRREPVWMAIDHACSRFGFNASFRSDGKIYIRKGLNAGYRLKMPDVEHFKQNGMGMTAVLSGIDPSAEAGYVYDGKRAIGVMHVKRSPDDSWHTELEF